MRSTTERSDLLGRLALHRTLGIAPHDELAWLATNGEPHSYAAGAVTTRQGEPEEWLQVVLSGHLTIRVDRGAGSRKIIEWRTGDVRVYAFCDAERLDSQFDRAIETVSRVARRAGRETQALFDPTIAQKYLDFCTGA